MSYAKKIWMLLTLGILISFSSFSQPTNNNTNSPKIGPDSTICIDIGTARQIAIDLHAGQYCEEELKLTQEKVIVLEEKSKTQDTVISNHKEQIVLYKEVITNKDTIIASKDVIITGQKETIKKQNRKITWMRIGVIAETVGLIVLLILF